VKAPRYAGLSSARAAVLRIGQIGLHRSDDHAGRSETMRETMRETPPGMAAPRPRLAAGSASKAMSRTSGQTTLHARPFAPSDRCA